MRIAYVINSIKRSGPNQVLLNIVSGLAGKGHEITVIAFFDGNSPEEVRKLKALDANVHILSVPKNRIPTIGAQKLRAYLSEVKPDVVHSHGILSDIAVIRAGYKSKSVTTIHNDMFEDYLFSFGKLKGVAYILLHLWYLRPFSQVVVCSSSALVKLKRFVKKAVFIHNGIAYEMPSEALDPASLRHELDISNTDKVFLYTGKLNARKNIISLLEQFARTHTSNEHLIVVGDGELMAQCQKYENHNIHIFGFQENVSKYYQIADVYVSASHAEGFSISVIEALQHGLLLLLSDIPAHKEVFEIDPQAYIGEIFAINDFGNIKSKLHYDENESVAYYQKYLTDKQMMSAYGKIYEEVTV